MRKAKRLIKAISKCNCGNCKNSRRVTYSDAKDGIISFITCIWLNDKVNPKISCVYWTEKGRG